MSNPQIYLLLEEVSLHIPTPANQRIINIDVTLYEGVRSNELHKEGAFNSRLSIAGLSERDIPAEAISSVNRGGIAAFHLLRKEGYIKRIVQAFYQLPAHTINPHGFSGDLAFALAFITNYLKGIPQQAIAATGQLDESGAVSKVEYIVEKLRSAVETLPSGSLYFLPNANKRDIPAALLESYLEQGISIYFIDHLEEACEHLGIRIQQYYRNNPFLGLHHFSLEQSTVFFGRNTEIDQGIELLKKRQKINCPSLLVLGQSGNGKSSFIQAGLLHEIKSSKILPNNTKVIHSIFTPRSLIKKTKPSGKKNEELPGFSDRLSETLYDHWLGILPNHANDRKTNTPFNDPASAIKWLKKRFAQLGSSATYIWIIDQLEELFTLDWTDQERHSFIELLIILPKNGIWILSALRSDFYTDYQNHTILFKHFQSDGQFDLLLPDKAALRTIISEPVRLAGLRFEEKQGIKLDERILSDIDHQITALPLLQLTLNQLYEKHDKQKKRLTFSAYKKIGNAKGAITNWAQTVYNGLPVEQQHHLPILLRHLTILSPSDKTYKVSARATFRDALPKLVLPLVDSLIKARLLLQNENGLIRVTHEVLLHDWELAQKQIEKDKLDLLNFQQLEQNFQLHTIAPLFQRKQSLLQGEQLKQATALEKNWSDLGSKSLHNFIKQSRINVFRKHIKILLSLFSSIFLIGVLYWLSYVRETEGFYRNIDRSQIRPLAVGPLSLIQHQKNDDHYKVIKHGWLGNIKEIVATNQFGECPVKSEKKPNAWVGDYNKDNCNCDTRICNIKFEYRSHNELISELGFSSSKDKPLYLITYTKESVNTWRGDYNGEVRLQPKSNANTIKFNMSKNKIATLSFYENSDNQDKPTVDQNGVYLYKYSYKNHITQEDFHSLPARLYDEETCPLISENKASVKNKNLIRINKRGVAGLKKTHNTEGDVVETLYLDDDNNSIPSRNNKITKITKKFDIYGNTNLVENAYLKNGKAFTELVKIERKQESSGKKTIIIKTIFKKDNKNLLKKTTSPLGFHKKIVSIDNRGRPTEVLHFDINQKKVIATGNDSKKFYRQLIEYRKIKYGGHEELSYYFDVNNESLYIKGSYHINKRVYNENGFLTKNLYFGKTLDTPVKINNSFHGYNLFYEKSGRGYLKSIELFDEEENLISDFNYSKYSHLFYKTNDDRGNHIESIGKDAMGRVLFSRIKRYNEYNRVLAKSFYGPKQERKNKSRHICNPNCEGNVWLQCNRLDDAGREVERHYYSTEGRFVEESHGHIGEKLPVIFAIKRQYYNNLYEHEPSCTVHWDSQGHLVTTNSDGKMLNSLKKCSDKQKEIPVRLLSKLTQYQPTPPLEKKIFEKDSP